MLLGTQVACSHGVVKVSGVAIMTLLSLTGIKGMQLESQSYQSCLQYHWRSIFFVWLRIPSYELGNVYEGDGCQGASVLPLYLLSSPR